MVLKMELDHTNARKDNFPIRASTKKKKKNTTGFSELDVQEPKLHLLTSGEALRLKQT